MGANEHIARMHVRLGSENGFPAPFVVGAGRSGTTLLRLMLDSHPDLAIPPETNMMPRVIRQCRDSQNNADDFLAAVTSSPRWPDFHMSAETLGERVRALSPFDLSEAIREYYRLYAAGKGKKRWGDKSPGHVQSLQLLARWLPEVRFLHMIRDGRDVALSILPLHFGPNTIEEAAHWWSRSIEKARRQARSIDFYMEIRYEELVENTEAVLRRTCRFIELPWDESILAYHQRAANRLTELGSLVTSTGEVIPAETRRGIHEMTTKPPNASRIEVWRTGMSDADRRVFESIAGNMLRDLGYRVGE
jgi:hypothetical protein